MSKRVFTKVADAQKLIFNSIFNAEVGQIISALFHLTC